MIYDKQKQEMNNLELFGKLFGPLELNDLSVSLVITKYFPTIHTSELVDIDYSETFQLFAMAPRWAWHSPRC